MNRDFESLKKFIIGREFDLAKQIIGLTDGNDTECHQPCPQCGGKDRFYVRKEKGTFHCRQCKLGGDIINLVANARNISLTEAFDIIAKAADYDNDTVHLELPKTIDVKSTRFQDGTTHKMEYIYVDENGVPRHKVNRIDGIDDSTGELAKTFSQWKIQDGEWVKGAPALTFPYRFGNTPIRTMSICKASFAVNRNRLCLRCCISFIDCVWNHRTDI